jgi:lipoprotein signal peptidase
MFAWSIVRLGRSGLAFGWRLTAGVGAFFAVAIGAHALSTPLAGVSIPAGVIISTIRVAVLAVSMALYAVSQATLPRVAFTLMAAGALSNAASYAYPPFAVVDFLVVPLAPLAGLIGRTATVAGEATVGVINLADVYLFLFALVLLAWPTVAVVTRARRAVAA